MSADSESPISISHKCSIATICLSRAVWPQCTIATDGQTDGHTCHVSANSRTSSRLSRWACGRRGRRLHHRQEPLADHGRTRTDMKDSESALRTGLRGGIVEDEVDCSSTVQDAELTVTRQAAAQRTTKRNVVGSRSEIGYRDSGYIICCALQPGYSMVLLIYLCHIRSQCT